MRMVIRTLAWLSFLCALALTALRFAQPDLPLARQALAFVPWSVPLYALAMLLFLGQVYFPGKSRWQVTLGLAAASMAGLVFHGWTMQQLFVGGHAEAPASAQQIRIFTFNVGDGRADPASIVSTAVASSADVVVLQQVTGSMLERMNQAGLTEAFPQHAGEPIANGNFGTMVFSEGSISEVTYLGAAQTSIQATLGLPGGTVKAIAVGIASPEDEATSDRWAADFAQLATVAGEIDPQLVVGAFEAGFDHREFRDLLDTGVSDVGERANVGFMRTWPVGEARFGMPTVRLTQPDHVLMGPPLVAVDQLTREVDGANHRALLAIVAFR